jgi:hypothetical protein
MKYHVEVSNRFAALEDLNVDMEINCAWETVGKNMNISAKENLDYYELKKHKPWFAVECQNYSIKEIKLNYGCYRLQVI